MDKKTKQALLNVKLLLGENETYITLKQALTQPVADKDVEEALFHFRDFERLLRDIENPYLMEDIETQEQAEQITDNIIQLLLSRFKDLEVLIKQRIQTPQIDLVSMFQEHYEALMGGVPETSSEWYYHLTTLLKTLEELGVKRIQKNHINNLGGE